MTDSILIPSFGVWRTYRRYTNAVVEGGKEPAKKKEEAIIDDHPDESQHCPSDLTLVSDAASSQTANTISNNESPGPKIDASSALSNGGDLFAEMLSATLSIVLFACHN